MTLPDDEELLTTTARAADAGEALLKEIASAGKGWFARDRAGIFGLDLRRLGSNRTAVGKAKAVHNQIKSLIAETESLVVHRTWTFFAALQDLEDARDALWECLAVSDAVERLGGRAE